MPPNTRKKRTRRERKQPEKFEAVPASRGHSHSPRTTGKPTSHTKPRRKAATKGQQQSGNAKKKRPSIQSAQKTTKQKSSATRRRLSNGSISSPKADENSAKKRRSSARRRKSTDSESVIGDGNVFFDEENNHEDGDDHVDRHEEDDDISNDEESVASAQESVGTMDTMGELSFRSNTKARRMSIEACELSKRSLSPLSTGGFSLESLTKSFPEDTAKYRPGCISQIVCEDIDCDPGLGFLDPLYDQYETLEHWQSKYQNGPGVSRVPTARPRKKTRRESNISAGSGGGAKPDVRFKSVIRHNGINLNLGIHQSSAAACAMQDLVNTTVKGSEHHEKVNILSGDEVWAALHAAKLDGAQPYRQVDQFKGLLTSHFKPVFEQKLLDGLSSIGGHDDVLADVLCNLDPGKQKEAEEADAFHAEELAEAKAERERQIKSHTRKARKLAKKFARRSRRIAENDYVTHFRGQHGIYGVNNEGKLFWFQNKSHAKMRRKRTPVDLSSRVKAKASTMTDVEMAEKPPSLFPGLNEYIAGATSAESHHLKRNAPNPNDEHTIDAEESSTDHSLSADGEESISSKSSSSSSVSYASTIASAASGRVQMQILSFDDVSDGQGATLPKTSRRLTKRDGPHQSPRRAKRSNFGETGRAPGIPDAITFTNTCLGEDGNSTNGVPEIEAPRFTKSLSGSDNRKVDRAKTIMQMATPLRSNTTRSSFDPLSSKIDSGAMNEPHISTGNRDFDVIKQATNDYIITPLFSFSQSGLRTAESDKIGKTLTSLRFRRKEIMSGQNRRNNKTMTEEFTIDISLNKSNVESEHVFQLREGQK